MYERFTKCSRLIAKGTLPSQLQNGSKTSEYSANVRRMDQRLMGIFTADIGFAAFFDEQWQTQVLFATFAYSKLTQSTPTLIKDPNESRERRA
jgi:hypothetical protein